MKTPDFFKRPEYLLASKITSSVLLALLAVIAVAGFFGTTLDDKRIEDFFERRLDMLANRRGDFSQTVTNAPRPDFESRLQEKRFLPQNLRNFAVVYPDGTVSVVGSLESSGIPVETLRGLPSKLATRRDIGDERYVMYATSLNEGRLLVLYEPEDTLVGPRATIFSSLILGLLAFSVVLFFISLSFARKVIRPIEEIAERERAYARHIAHELKTPLAVAKSDIQLALAVKEGSEEHLRSAIAEIGSMRDTVDDLLLFSASGSLARTEPVSLEKILLELVSKSGVPERFDVVSEADAPESVPADSKIASTLFRNLVSNALVHAPSDSKISVRFSSTGFSFTNPAPDADPKVLAKAFDTFVGTPGKGSGIGLSLVKRIAEAHGWTPTIAFGNGKVTVSVTYGKFLDA